MVRKLLLSLSLALFLSAYALGCAPSSSVPVDTLLAAPEEVTIGGQRYILETYLNRDFMPSSPPDGKPLTALVWVRALVPPRSLPALKADLLWIINGREVWEVDVRERSLPFLPDDGSVLGKQVDGGPKWPAGDRVEVVIRLIDDRGHTFLLRAAEQEIHASR